MNHRQVYPDAVTAAEACGDHVAARLEEALRGGGTATLAISGGSSPQRMFRALAQSSVDWTRVHLFWVDERCVPPEDPQSNYGMARRELIEPAGIPQSNVHRALGEATPANAVRAYFAEMRSVFAGDGTPEFDVIHVGMGADGHTASLFPGEPLVEDRTGVTAAVYVEKIKQWRVTLLPAVLLAARHTVVLATGADKAATIRAVLEDGYEPARLPMQMVAHQGRNVTWFLDRAAAGKGTAPT